MTPATPLDATQPADIESCQTVAPEHRRAYRCALIALFILALACRVYIVSARDRVEPDGASFYLPIARAVALGQPFPSYHVSVPVLYSQITGHLARIVGDVALSGQIVSLLGSMMMCLFVFLLTRRLIGPYAALAALGLAAFNPFQCRQASETLLDALFAGWFAGVAYFLVVYLQKPSFRRAAVAGIVIALMVLTRVEAFAYAFVALALMAFFPSDGRFRVEGRRLAHAAAGLLVIVIVCLPRIVAVHRDTGWWVTDTRQVARPVYLWNHLTGASVRVPEAYESTVLATTERKGRNYLVMAERIGAAFGPASLLFGGWALYRRRRRARRIEWVPAVLIVAGLVVVNVGSAFNRRYYLSMAALGQAWAGAGLIAFLQYGIAAPLVRRFPARAWLRAVPFLLFLTVAVTFAQIPYSLAKVERHEQAAERAAGAWILRQYGPGVRLFSTRAIVTWYAQGESIRYAKKRIPEMKTWTAAQVAAFCAENHCRLILMDDEMRKLCPVFAAEFDQGKLSGVGAVLDLQTQGQRFAVVELPR